MEEKNLGERIALLRIEARLSQKELADKLYYSKQTVSGWEQNRTEPSIDALKSLAKFFGVTISEIIGSGVLLVLFSE